MDKSGANNAAFDLINAGRDVPILVRQVKYLRVRAKPGEADRSSCCSNVLPLAQDCREATEVGLVAIKVCSLPGESSPLRTATLTCARQCAPSSVQRIWRFLAMRWLTTRFTADSAMLLLIGRPFLYRAP